MVLKRHSNGFTLIELMVTVAAIAIISSVAYPSYTRYMARMHRAQAQSYLMQVAQREHQYFLDSREYAAQATILALEPVPADVAAQYTVSIGPSAPTTPPTFVVTAVPRAGSAQAARHESTLSIAQDGKRTPSGVWQ
jgi:type IV pilus assembly protein PilE